MGGDDLPYNIVELTVSEHADAHRVLWETFNHYEDYIEWKALLGMITKEEVQKELSALGGRKGKGRKNPFAVISNKRRPVSVRFNPYAFAGKKHTEESKRKIGNANQGRIPWNKGKKWVSVGKWI